MNPLKVSAEDFETAELHFNAFTFAFLIPELGERWRELFSLATPRKWWKIDPWVMWDERKIRDGAEYLEVVEQIAGIARNVRLCPRPDVDAVVISVGHSRPSMAVKPFSKLAAIDWPLEGLISLEAGRRVFVMNHDGDVILCVR